MNPYWNRVVRALGIDGVPVTIVFIVMIVFFAVASPYFLTSVNITNLFVESVFAVLLAAAMTYVLITGGIDLSVGSTMGLSAGVTMATLMSGAPTVVGIGAGIVTGLVIGAINGLLIAMLGVNDFIVTLATLSIGAGALQVLTSSTQLTGVDRPAFAGLTKSVVLGIPMPVVLTAVVVVVLEVVLLKTTFGRQMYAVGINHQAAFLAGVGTRALRLRVYLLSGGVAGAAGVLLASHLNSVQPGLGSGYELTAIAAAVLGGIALSGGRGSVWRAVIGAFFLSTLSQGLQLLGVDPIWFSIVTGACIVGAVAFDRALARLIASALRGRPRPPDAPRPLPTPGRGSAESLAGRV